MTIGVACVFVSNDKRMSPITYHFEPTNQFDDIAVAEFCFGVYCLIRKLYFVLIDTLNKTDTTWNHNGSIQNTVALAHHRKSMFSLKTITDFIKNKVIFIYSKELSSNSFEKTRNKGHCSQNNLFQVFIFLLYNLSVCLPKVLSCRLVSSLLSLSFRPFPMLYHVHPVIQLSNSLYFWDNLPFSIELDRVNWLNHWPKQLCI